MSYYNFEINFVTFVMVSQRTMRLIGNATRSDTIKTCCYGGLELVVNFQCMLYIYLCILYTTSRQFSMHTFHRSRVWLKFCIYRRQKIILYINQCTIVQRTQHTTRGLFRLWLCTGLSIASFSYHIFRTLENDALYFGLEKIPCTSLTTFCIVFQPTSCRMQNTKDLFALYFGLLFIDCRSLTNIQFCTLAHLIQK